MCVCFIKRMPILLECNCILPEGELCQCLWMPFTSMWVIMLVTTRRVGVKPEVNVNNQFHASNCKQGFEIWAKSPKHGYQWFQKRTYVIKYFNGMIIFSVSLNLFISEFCHVVCCILLFLLFYKVCNFFMFERICY